MIGSQVKMMGSCRRHSERDTAQHQRSVPIIDIVLLISAIDASYELSVFLILLSGVCLPVARLGKTRLTVALHVIPDASNVDPLREKRLLLF